MPRITMTVLGIAALLPAGLLATTPRELAAAVERFEAGDLEAAHRGLQALEARRQGSPETAYYIGRIHFAQGDLEEATEWLERAAERAPESAEARLWLGRTYGLQARDANLLRRASLAGKTRDAWLEARALDPDNLEVRSSLIQFFLQAPSLMGGGLDKAQAEAAEIAKRDPVAGCHARASILEHQEDLPGAAAEYRKALAIDPEHRPSRFGLGLLQQRMEEWAGALSTFEALVAADPEDLVGHYQIGRTAALSGQGLGRGAEALRLYLGSEPGPEDPSLAWAHYRLSQVLERQGNRREARSHLEAALRLDPGHEEAKKALRAAR